MTYEQHKTFTVTIVGFGKTSQYAVTHWHAIEKAYAQYSHIVPERTKYICNHKPDVERPEIQSILNKF